MKVERERDRERETETEREREKEEQEKSWNWRHEEIEIVWKEIIKVNVGPFITGKGKRDVAGETLASVKERSDL